MVFLSACDFYTGIAPTVPAPHPEAVNGTGWVYLTNSYNSDCSAPFLSYGVPVGQCIVEDKYAYKFNVVQGLCGVNLIIEHICTCKNWIISCI